MSLLLSEGHPQARHYPIGMVWQESEIATARINNLVATNALLIQAAIGAALSREGGQHFKDAVDDLTEG